MNYKLLRYTSVQGNKSDITSLMIKEKVVSALSREQSQSAVQNQNSM